jgi:hypothetical protein
LHAGLLLGDVFWDLLTRQLVFNPTLRFICDCTCSNCICCCHSEPSSLAVG